MRVCLRSFVRREGDCYIHDLAAFPRYFSYHTIQEFNKGIYDIIIAVDENSTDDRASRGGRRVTMKLDYNGAILTPEKSASLKKKPKLSAAQKDKEFGISRGIDFRNVEFVINFDVPLSHESYVHRVGRTARAGKSGMGMF